MEYHYLANNIASTMHKVTINVVGCGGTGSHVLSSLAAMNHALVSMGRQPLHVKAFDPDVVTEHNVGRQAFSTADIGENKANVLISRINRFYGAAWTAVPTRFGIEKPRPEFHRDFFYGANFTISCVDTVESRKEIQHVLHEMAMEDTKVPDYAFPYYWMDIGNSDKFGQVILGTVKHVPQLAREQQRIEFCQLPDFFAEFPYAKDNPVEPSCSMAESLMHQDLFINKIMATYAIQMLWELLMQFRINYRGLYVNLNDGKTSKIFLD